MTHKAPRRPAERTAGQSDTHEFDPHWVVHPGETVREVLESFDLLYSDKPRAAARLLHMTPEALKALIDCEPDGRVTEAAAEGLATFSASKQFWLNLQAQYDEGTAKGYV